MATPAWLSVGQAETKTTKAQVKYEEDFDKTVWHSKEAIAPKGFVFARK